MCLAGNELRQVAERCYTIREMKKALFIFAVLVLLVGCTETGKGDAQRVVITVSENGTVSFNGNKVNKEKLRENLKKQVDNAPKERHNDSTKEYPILQVLIETESNVRWEGVVEMLDECSNLNLWQTYFSNPRVNGGKEVKLWLPVLSDKFYAQRIEKPIVLLEEEVEVVHKIPEAVPSFGSNKVNHENNGVNEKNEKQDKEEGNQGDALPVKDNSERFAGENIPQPHQNKATPAVNLCEIRIKLLWVDPENLRKCVSMMEDPEGTKGIMALKIKNSFLMKDKQPDWNILSDLLKQVIKHYTPTKSFKTPPVIIDARPKVFFADVLRCVVICQKAGIEKILLARPYHY